MLVDKIGDFQLIIDVVGHTVVGHVADELGLELHVFEGVLEIVQIHVRYLIPQLMLMWLIIIDLDMNTTNCRIICDKITERPTKQKLHSLLNTHPGATLAIKKDCIYLKFPTSTSSGTFELKESSNEVTELTEEPFQLLGTSEELLAEAEACPLQIRSVTDLDQLTFPLDLSALQEGLASPKKETSTVMCEESAQGQTEKQQQCWKSGQLEPRLDIQLQSKQLIEQASSNAFVCQPESYSGEIESTEQRQFQPDKTIQQKTSRKVQAISKEDLQNISPSEEATQKTEIVQASSPQPEVIEAKQPTIEEKSEEHLSDLVDMPTEEVHVGESELPLASKVDEPYNLAEIATKITTEAAQKERTEQEQVPLLAAPKIQEKKAEERGAGAWVTFPLLVLTVWVAWLIIF